MNTKLSDFDIEAAYEAAIERNVGIIAEYSLPLTPIELADLNAAGYDCTNAGTIVLSNRRLTIEQIRRAIDDITLHDETTHGFEEAFEKGRAAAFFQVLEMFGEEVA